MSPTGIESHAQRYEHGSHCSEARSRDPTNGLRLEKHALTTTGDRWEKPRTRGWDKGDRKSKKRRRASDREKRVCRVFDPRTAAAPLGAYLSGGRCSQMEVRERWRPSADPFNDVRWPTCLAPAPARSKAKTTVRVDAVVLVVVVVVAAIAVAVVVVVVVVVVIVVVVDDVVLAPTHGPYVGARFTVLSGGGGGVWCRKAYCYTHTHTHRYALTHKRAKTRWRRRRRTRSG